MPAIPLKDIPGDHLEGGGQLLRTATCLSALTGTPIRLTNIRGGRPRGGGLKEQHVASMGFLGGVCEADIEGLQVGEREVEFVPGGWRSTRKKSFMPIPTWTLSSLFQSDITMINFPTSDPPLAVLTATLTLQNAGATTLLLQALLPFLLLTPSRIPYLLDLFGGTNVSFSPSIDYITQVLFPNLLSLGFPPMRLLPRTFRRGWSQGRGCGMHAAGAGRVSFLVEPLPKGEMLPALRLKRHAGKVKSITATILASGEARLLLRSAVQRTCATVPDWAGKVQIGTDQDSGHAKRLYLLLVAETETDGGLRIGRDWLYSKKIRDVGTAVDELVQRVVDGLRKDVEGGRVVDEWMEDQLVVFMGLAAGRSGVVEAEEEAKAQAKGEATKSNKVTTTPEEETNPPLHAPTLHTLTARWLVSTLLDVTFDAAGSCDGAGFVAGCGVPETQK